MKILIRGLAARSVRSLARVVFFAMVLSPSGALALDPRRNIDEFGLATWSDSLPQNTVHTIHQTRDGYLWIGTYEGFVRFDGVRFTVFDKRNLPVLKNNGVFGLFEDSRGSLWIATAGGGVVRVKLAGSERYDMENGLAGDIATSIQEDGQGRVWIATTFGVSRFANGKLEQVATPPNAVPRRLFKDAAGDIWIGYENGVVEHAGVASTTRFGSESGLPHKAILGIAQDLGGTIWVGSSGAGLYALEGGRFVPRTDGLMPGDTIVRSLLADRHGALWIGTEGRGLVRYWDGRFTALTSRDGLPSDVVRSILEDREGSLWIGTNGGGLAVLREQKFVTYSKENGLSNDNVRCVIEDRPGSFWIGTDGGGLNHLADGAMTTFTTKQGLPNNYIKALYSDANGDLWIGTTGAGLVRMRDGRFTSFTTRDGLPNDIVYAIQRDSAGSLWIGTNGGAARMREERFEVFSGRGLPGSSINSIAEDSRGTLWFAKARGAMRYREGRFEEVTMKDGPVRDAVFSFHEDKEGSLWIGTSGGLLRIRDGLPRRYTRRNGLFDDLVFQVLEDDRGFLWMSSNRGIARVAKRDLDALDAGTAKRVSAVSFGRADGMRSAQCNGVSQPAAWRSSSGRLWFATNRGVAVVDPSNNTTNPFPPPVLIERVLVDGVATNGPKDLTIPPGTDRIEIDYTALSFISPEKVRFRYRLEGRETKWTDAEGRRTAYYSTLPPGHYSFHVVASNNDGVWNETGASIRIRIRPFFYQKLSFRLLAIALVFCFLLLLHRIRLRSIEKHRQDLALLVGKRTAELAEANRELERLSSIDALTGIANRRKLDITLESEWKRGVRGGTELSMLMIDIDFFKEFNDAFGHQAGDHCLMRIAHRVAAEFRRPEDVVARYGGEELAVVLPFVASVQAVASAERVRASIEGLRIPHPASKAGADVTISIGVATLRPRVDRAASDLIAAADEALYRAKAEGRNRVVTSTATPESSPA